MIHANIDAGFNAKTARKCDLLELMGKSVPWQALIDLIVGDSSQESGRLF